MNDLELADELFFTGTASEVTPIRSIDDKLISNGHPGEITSRLRDYYMDIVFGKNIKYHCWLSLLNNNETVSNL